ncbi:MAG: hypothetical protein C3F13_13775 [Anaerolineales bacterium]|nr:MAG: hypothetical protein C3F13_13775 [Anaerolineales bacterium]
MRRKIHVRSVLIVMLLAICFVIPASATKPVHEREAIEIDFPDWDTCGPVLGVWVAGHLDMRGSSFLWFDKDGQIVGETFTGSNVGSVSYEDRTVHTRASGLTRITYLGFENGVWRDRVEISGTSWIMAIPGHGAVVGTSGRSVFEEACVEVTPGDWQCSITSYEWSGISFDDQELLCNYLVYGE